MKTAAVWVSHHAPETELSLSRCHNHFHTAAYFKDIPDFKFIVLNKNKSIDNLEDITDYDLVIVTTTLYSRIVKVGMEKTIKFQRVIYDEIDNLNLSGYTSLDANFYWLVTASYGNTLYPRGLAKFDSHINRYVWFADGLKNSGYVKTMLLDIHSSIPRELMKVMIVKNSDEYVFSSIQLPEIFSNIILCKTPTSINILNGIVDKNIISCLNAGDVQAANTAYANACTIMPGKINFVKLAAKAIKVN